MSAPTGWLRFAVLVVAVLATSLWGAAMVRRLNGVRQREAVQIAVMQAPPVPRGGGDPVAQIRAAVAGSGVAIERLATAGRQGAAARAVVTLVGPEAAMRGVLLRLEAGRPAIRFSEWRLAPEPGAADGLRFDGVALAWPGEAR